MVYSAEIHRLRKKIRGGKEEKGSLATGGLPNTRIILKKEGRWNVFEKSRVSREVISMKELSRRGKGRRN